MTGAGQGRPQARRAAVALCGSNFAKTAPAEPAVLPTPCLPVPMPLERDKNTSELRVRRDGFLPVPTKRPARGRRAVAEFGKAADAIFVSAPPAVRSKSWLIEESLQ